MESNSLQTVIKLIIVLHRVAKLATASSINAAKASFKKIKWLHPPISAVDPVSLQATAKGRQLTLAYV